MTAPLRLITSEESPFERLLGSVLRRSHCVALQLVGDRDGAEQLLREAAVVAFGGWRRDGAAADFGLWFLQILAELYRARFTDRRPIARSASGDEVTGAFQELPPDDRLVNALYFAAGLRYAEIAGVSGLTVSAVRDRLHRGRRKLLHLVAGAAARS